VKRKNRNRGNKSRLKTLAPSRADLEKNQIVREATERFLRSGITIEDVYGKLSEPSGRHSNLLQR